LETSISNQLPDIINSVINAVPTQEIILFGSYARGTPKPDSDLDIYILTSDDKKRPIDYLRDINRSLRSFRTLPIDILVTPYHTFYERAKFIPTLEYTVLKEGQRIYGQ